MPPATPKEDPQSTLKSIKEAKQEKVYAQRPRLGPNLHALPFYNGL
jgi:hypothetical protein